MAHHKSRRDTEFSRISTAQFFSRMPKICTIVAWGVEQTRSVGPGGEEKRSSAEDMMFFVKSLCPLYSLR